MKIYTSYFGNKKLNNLDLVQIAICLYPPKWYNGIIYSKIAPNYEILMDWKNGKKDEEAKYAYEKAYKRHILRRLNKKDIISDLEKLSNGKDIVLLCFEKPSEFCHRHIFAKEIFNELGISIEEII